jgi:hypothetical protein
LPLRPGESGGAAATSSGKGNSIIFNDSIFKLKVSINKEVDGRIISESSVEVISGDMYNFDPGKDISLMLVDSKMGDKRYKPNSFNANNTYYISTLFGIKSSGGAKKEDSGKRKSSGGGGGQTTGGEILIDEAHRGLSNLVDANSPDYVYTTSADGTSATFTYKGKPGSRTLDKTYAKWPEFVSQMNSFPIGNATKTAPAATTTAPTTPSGAEAAKAPVLEGEAAGLQTRRVVSDATVMNVAKVLTDVYGGATYAGRTVFRNEMGMVRKMMDQLNTTAQSLGVTIGSAEALAQIITPSIRPGLGRFGTANLDGLGERDMEKQYRAELNLIMTAVKNLFDRIKKSPAQLLNYQPNFRAAYEAKNAGKAGAKSPAANTTPVPSAPATPTTEGTPAPKAEAEANDGSSFGKKSSLNSKFKKLAKLRRLRVRGQMESAIEPSARLGVSRVS